MKPRPDIKPLLGLNNVVAINRLRLRRRIQATVGVQLPSSPQAAYLRKAAVKARTGGHYRG